LPDLTAFAVAPGTDQYVLDLRRRKWLCFRFDIHHHWRRSGACDLGVLGFAGLGLAGFRKI
jgi:hypothetical protein